MGKLEKGSAKGGSENEELTAGGTVLMGGEEAKRDFQDEAPLVLKQQQE